MPQGWKRAGLDNSALAKALVLSLPIEPVPLWRAALIAAICIVVSTLVRIAIDPWVQGVPFITFFPGVVIASLWGGVAAGVATLLVCAAIGAYYWIQPYGAISLTAVADATVFVFILVGLLIVGLDLIGDCLTEINVTSPTCFVEIAQQTGFDVAGMFIDALERACGG